MKRLFCLVILSCFFLCFFISACHIGSQSAKQTAAAANFKVYKLRGKVVSTQAATSEVTLDHEAIPNFMGAMTMPYKLKDATILSELHPGDRLTADVLVSQNPDANVLLDHIVIIAQARADYLPSVQYHLPTKGDVVPDFKLTNQDGRAIHLGQFRGQAVLITFIYTRCPLPNYCPRVTRNFAAIEKNLAANPALLNKTHLICASFDPETDTPAELRAYGLKYVGSDAKQAFAHWDFAVSSRQQLNDLTRYFNLGMTRESDASITHTLSTTLIGPDGKVVRFYPGNEWTADQITTDLRKLLEK